MCMNASHQGNLQGFTEQREQFHLGTPHRLEKRKLIQKTKNNSFF